MQTRPDPNRKPEKFNFGFSFLNSKLKPNPGMFHYFLTGNQKTKKRKSKISLRNSDQFPHELKFLTILTFEVMCRISNQFLGKQVWIPEEKFLFPVGFWIKNLNLSN
jgi:hypothetical protein